MTPARTLPTVVVDSIFGAWCLSVSAIAAWMVVIITWTKPERITYPPNSGKTCTRTVVKDLHCDRGNPFGLLTVVVGYAPQVPAELALPTRCTPRLVREANDAPQRPCHIYIIEFGRLFRA